MKQWGLVRVAVRLGMMDRVDSCTRNAVSTRSGMAVMQHSPWRAIDKCQSRGREREWGGGKNDRDQEGIGQRPGWRRGVPGKCSQTWRRWQEIDPHHRGPGLARAFSKRAHWSTTHRSIYVWESNLIITVYVWVTETARAWVHACRPGHPRVTPWLLVLSLHIHTRRVHFSVITRPFPMKSHHKSSLTLFVRLWRSSTIEFHFWQVAPLLFFRSTDSFSNHKKSNKFQMTFSARLDEIKMSAVVFGSLFTQKRTEECQCNQTPICLGGLFR